MARVFSGLCRCFLATFQTHLRNGVTAFNTDHSLRVLSLDESPYHDKDGGHIVLNFGLSEEGVAKADKEAKMLEQQKEDKAEAMEARAEEALKSAEIAQGLAKDVTKKSAMESSPIISMFLVPELWDAIQESEHAKEIRKMLGEQLVKAPLDSLVKTAKKDMGSLFPKDW